MFVFILEIRTLGCLGPGWRHSLADSVEMVFDSTCGLDGFCSDYDNLVSPTAESHEFTDVH